MKLKRFGRTPRRPRSRRAAEPSYELAPFHSITSSARANSFWRHIEAKRLGGLEIDDQLYFRGLLDWQVAGLCALENIVTETSSAARR